MSKEELLEKVKEQQGAIVALRRTLIMVTDRAVNAEEHLKELGVEE